MKHWQLIRTGGPRPQSVSGARTPVRGTGQRNMGLGHSRYGFASSVMTVLLVLSLLMGWFSGPAPALAQSRPGDVNGDGKVNQTDLDLV